VTARMIAGSIRAAITLPMYDYFIEILLKHWPDKEKS